jgi:hypothetical protein
MLSFIEIVRSFLTRTPASPLETNWVNFYIAGEFAGLAAVFDLQYLLLHFRTHPNDCLSLKLLLTSSVDVATGNAFVLVHFVNVRPIDFLKVQAVRLQPD